MALGVTRPSRNAPVEPFKVTTAGDLEAVILAESFELLSDVVGPYMYRVSGEPGQQQAMFASSELLALFYIRVHEFLADATDISRAAGIPSTLSLLSGGLWLADRYVTIAGGESLRAPYERARDWFDRRHRLVFWAPSVWRHLRLELSMGQLIAMRSNLAKHQVLRLNNEIRRLQSSCGRSGCELTAREAVAVRDEFDEHLRGMLEYYSTEVAELVAGCLLGLHRFVRELYERHPTNNLDLYSYPDDIADDVFRYMHARTVFQLAQWNEARITSSLPSTSPSFTKAYPQHREWDDPEFDRRDA